MPGRKTHSRFDHHVVDQRFGNAESAASFSLLRGNVEHNGVRLTMNSGARVVLSMRS
jgi:hypothetical protein